MVTFILEILKNVVNKLNNANRTIPKRIYRNVKCIVSSHRQECVTSIRELSLMLANIMKIKNVPRNKKIIFERYQSKMLQVEFCITFHGTDVCVFNF